MFRQRENLNRQRQIPKISVEICESPEEISRESSFEAPYEQFTNCAEPYAIYYHDTNIPSGGNCFFFSVMRIMNLSLLPSEIRQKLLVSPFVDSYINPVATRLILSSEAEYAEMDCIRIFSQVYNKNVCVHYHYSNTKTHKEEQQFLHLRVNDSGSFLHLHLRNTHFTPLIIVEEMNVNNGTYNPDLDNDIPFELLSDVGIITDDNHGNDAHNAISLIQDNNVTILTYSNYYKHANGHPQFNDLFKKNTFGHSCTVCDRLWW